MKKVVIALVVIVLTLSANAQVKLGVQAGLNISNQKYITSGVSHSPEAIMGFRAGLIADMPINKNIAIQPGLLFSQKGRKEKTLIGEQTYNFNYLDIPVNIVLKLIASKKIKILFHGGPTFSYAINGKYKIDNKSTDIEFGSEAGKYKHFDMSLGFGGGVQYRKLLFSVNYNIGMANIYNVSGNSDLKIKNNVFGASVGYFFGKCH